MPVMPSVKRRPSAYAGGGLGPGAVRGRRRVHLERGGVRGAPDRVSGGRVERLHHLVLPLAGEEVEAVAEQQGRRVAEADLAAPLPGEPLRPGRGRVEGRHRAVAQRSAPLRPVLRRRVADTAGGNDDDHRGGEQGGQPGRPNEIWFCHGVRLAPSVCVSIP